MTAQVRIPFDSVCLAAVVAEAQCLKGARLEQIIQTDPLTVVLTFWSGSAAWLLVSADPSYARAYIITRRPEGLKPVPAFATELRRHLADATVTHVRQRGLDRVLEIGFSEVGGDYELIAELMGKHANTMLVGPDNKLLAAAKWVGPGKSVRPVLPGQPYCPPPFEPKPSLLEATEGSDLGGFDGGSPFLIKLTKSGFPLSEAIERLRSADFTPVYSHGNGAYPLSVASLGLEQVSRSSIGQALEQHFESQVSADRFVHAKTSLRSQLERVLLAREVALNDVSQALETARDARAIQIRAELILAYQGSIQPGDRELSAWGYDGEPVTVQLRADLTPVENAERYFLKAKKAKAHAGEVETQQARLDADRTALEQALAELDIAETVSDVEELKQDAADRRWLQKSGEAKAKVDRPFEGHAVKELLSPAGWRVLYGENATANDYLTTKLARPSDLWFHVRGAPSAHVVLCTNNQPNRVQTPDLTFAATVAARHSTSKHASYVSVDYTQRRYVRKPRGAAPGLAVYTHEKTIHVSG